MAAWVERDGRIWTAKISDFGNAIIEPHRVPEMTLLRNVIGGTPPNKAPELDTDTRFTVDGAKATDIFSYGMLVFRYMSRYSGKTGNSDSIPINSKGARIDMEEIGQQDSFAQSITDIVVAKLQNDIISLSSSQSSGLSNNDSRNIVWAIQEALLSSLHKNPRARKPISKLKEVLTFGNPVLGETMYITSVHAQEAYADTLKDRTFS